MTEDVVVAIQCQPFGPVLQRQVIDEIEELRFGINAMSDNLVTMVGKAAALRVEYERLRKVINDAVKEARLPHYGDGFTQLGHYEGAILILEAALEGK